MLVVEDTLITHQSSSRNFYIFGNLDFLGKSAAAKRMLYYAKALSSEKHKVYLISCCSSELSQDKFLEVEPHIFVLKDKKLTRSFFSTISFLRRLNDLSKRNTGDSIFLLYPHPVFMLEIISIFYMIFVKKNRVFLEVNEIRKYSSKFHEPISLKRIRYSFRLIFYKTIYSMMDNLMRFYHGIICISTNIQAYGSRFNKNTLLVPILTDSEMLIETSSKSYSKNDSFNVGFSGSILPSKENLWEFVEVVKKIQKKKGGITFNLCGSISKKDYEDLIGKDSEENIIRYHGNLDKRELSTFLIQQDLLVIPRGFTLQNKYGFSTKLSDYLNHKKAILVTDISDNALYIKDGQNGFIVPPDDHEKMYQKMNEIIENFDDLEEAIVANAFKTSKEKFDYRLYRKDLFEFLIS